MSKNSIKTICLDPGHGGRDPGAVGNGMRESDIVLEVCHFLRQILEKYGVRVQMTRSTDVALTVNERWQVANTVNADLFLSIHVNAFNLSSANGAETFIFDNGSERTRQSRAFGSELLRRFVAETGIRDRGVRLDGQSQHSGGLGVLRNTRMPATLFELAFISADSQFPDVRTLRDRRQEMAMILAEGVLAYLQIETPPPKPSQAFPISAANIQSMVNLGVIQSPDFWQGVDSVQWLDELLANASQLNRLHRAVNNGIGDLESALTILEQAGLMNSPNYWRKQAKNSGIAHLGQLIINIANRSLDPLHRIVWAESRGEDLRGQIMVANVIMNRHNSPQFPYGFYNVIQERRYNDDGTITFQFSPIGNGAYDRATPQSQNLVLSSVEKALDGADHSQGALFFRGVQGLEGSWHQQALNHLFTHGGHAFFS